MAGRGWNRHPEIILRFQVRQKEAALRDSVQCAALSKCVAIRPQNSGIHEPIARNDTPDLSIGPCRCAFSVQGMRPFLAVNA